jgi:HlyD family secretion protein
LSVAGKRLLFWAVAATALGVGLAWSFRPQPVPVDLEQARVVPLVVTVDEEGKTRVREVFVVSAPVMGRVRRIQLDVGDTVDASQTLVAEIEPSDPAFLDQRARAEAEAEVAAAEAALVLARAEVEEAKAELEFAEAELARASRLSDTGTISEQSVDDARRVFRTRRAALTTAQAQVRVAEHGLDRVRSRLTSPVSTAARGEVCECVVLTSPVSGRVLEVHRESEGVVAAGEALVSVGDPADLEVVAEMLSTEAVKVRPGMRVIVDGWGGEQPLEGEVVRVEPFGFTKISALGIEEQRVNVVVARRGDAADWRSLGHGFRVDVRVVVWEAEAVLTVPVTALFRDGEAWALYVVEDGIARHRMVAVGRRAGLAVQVTQGLDAGEAVVVSPGERVRDGAAVVARGR